MTGDASEPRWLGALVAALPLGLGLPSVVAGPGFHADDWFFLARARFVDPADVGGIRQSTRPVANLLYWVEFSVIGERPAVLRALLLVLAGLVAWLLLQVLRLVVDHRTAAVATLVWIILPTHLSAERWASAGQASLALAFVLGGAVVLLRRPPAPGRALAGVGLLCLGVLSYELVIGLAAVVVAGSAARHRAVAYVPLVAGALGLGAVLLWRTTEPGVYAAGALGGPPDLIRGVVANLSTGVDPDLAAARLLAVGWLVAAGATLWLARRRAASRAPALAVVVGALVLVAGLAPLIQIDPSFTGLGDRFNTVASLGAAVLVAGVLRALAPGRRFVLVAALAAVPALAGRLALEQDWHRSGESAEAYVTRLDATLPSDGAFDMRTAVREGEIDGITDGWHATAALQLRRGEDAPLGCFDGIAGSGPGCGAADPVVVE